MKKRGVLFLAGIVMMLLKVPIAPAQDTVRLSLYFDDARSVLNTAAVASLDSLAASITGRQAEAVRITGNTDDRGSHDYNQQLSDARAQAVFDHLAGRGISSSELEILGQGKSLPAYPGKDESSRAGNRRVDLVVVLATGDGKDDAPAGPATVANARESATIVAGNGIRLTIPAGSFHPLVIDSLSFKPLLQTDMGKLATAGMTTLSAQGDVLAIAGLFSLQVGPLNPLTDSIRLSQAVEVMIPVKTCACQADQVDAWQKTAGPEGQTRWTAVAGDSVMLTRQSGRQYYVFRVFNLQPVALACPIPAKETALVLKDLDSVDLRLAFPRSRVISGGKAVMEGVLTISLPVKKEIPRIYATAWAEGEKYMIKGKRLDELRKNLFTGQYVMSRKDFRKVPGRSPRKVDEGEVIYGYHTETR